MSVNGFKVNNVVEKYNYASLDNLPDLEGAIAGAYSSTSTYNVGDYVWRNGSLYRCNTAITTGEAWTAAHWTAAVLGNDADEIKSALNHMSEISGISWTIGKYVNGSGAVITSQYMAMTEYLDCHPGDVFLTTSPTTDNNNKFLVYYVCEYNNGAFVRRTELTSSVRSVAMGSTTNRVRICFGRYSSSGIAITQADIDTYVTMYLYTNGSLTFNTFLRESLPLFIKDTYVYDGNDVNDINENSVCFCAEGTTNLPTATGGYFVMTVLHNASGAAAFQQAFRFDNGITYYRRKVSSQWRSWICNSAPSNPSRPIYYAFGDSLTYGAVWTSKEEAPYYQIDQAFYEYQIPTRIANAIGASGSFSNKGVGGAYFVGSGDNKIINAIKAQDLSSAKIITIAGGRNDSENALGDKTSTAGDGTICGAIREILDWVVANYKQLQIVWIGVTPNTSNNDTVFTRVFAGGWSLNSFDEKVSELCAEYSVPYVSWKMCTYMRHWADYSGAGNVYSHPNNEGSYLQMGNYIAGQVAQYYIG